MWFHLHWLLPDFLPRVAHFGWMGVDLFFVLSGYLIGSQPLKAHQAGAGVGLWRFYRRRLYRILPAYLVVVALYFLWPAWREDPGISPLWEFLTFTENLFVNYDLNHAFSHVWSLCIEEQFYLVLPMIVLVMMRRPSVKRTAWLIAGLVGVGIAVRTYEFFHVLRPLGAEDASVKYIERIYYPTWCRMDGLLAGVSLALVRVFRPGWWDAMARWGWAMLAGGLGLVAIALWLFDDRFASQTGAAEWGTFVGFPVLSVGLGLVMASSMSGRGWIRIPGAQWVATLAYSLYLSHKAVVHVAEIYLPSLTAEHGVKAAVVCGVACLVGAVVLHFGVERPFMVLRDRGRVKAVEEEMRLDPAV